MSLGFSKLERILQDEKKNCEDHVVIGGLEPFINNWATSHQTGGNEVAARIATNVEQVLEGYGAAEPATRRQMLERALSILEEELTREAHPQVPEDEFVQSPEPASPDRPIRMSADTGLDAPVTRLQNVGPAFAKKLQRLGISSVRDLLFHFPHRYDDYRKLKKVSELVYGEEVTLMLSIVDCKTRETINRRKITNVLLSDSTGAIQATFFNQPFLQQQFRSGRKIVISGRVDRDLNRLAFKHPEWEPFSSQLFHTARLVPVYPLTDGITNRWLRRLTKPLVDHWAPLVTEPLSDGIRREHQLVDLQTALNEIHYPSSTEKMEKARRRLAFEEFLIIQTGVLQQRRKWRDRPGKALEVARDRAAIFIGSLNFKLTSAQERALDEIFVDLQQSKPMSRLLQGDVGSGKTVVAAAAMLVAVWNGCQAALMAPTEILAEQHFKTLTKVYGGEGPRVRLLTGSSKDREKEEIRAALAEGTIDVVVGTHALIQERVTFKELALAVIDEQHRFGVEHRGTIRSKGNAADSVSADGERLTPHILVMSATPIPRTLALTVYGDLDISLIDEMPPGRQEIKTHWLGPGERERAYSFIRKQIAVGRQAYVICPLIEESESIDAKAAVDAYERLRTEIYPDLRVGLIHGKLRPREKDETMGAFRERNLDILVATSVIEVGIDVPNATVMLIEGADRFGLAQLHQFRGRVGRGEHQSYCLLLAEHSGSTSDERLKVIESTQNGFRLAEEDLKLRGPGEFFGTRQSGLPDLKVARLSDVRILEQARSAALKLFDRDPDLEMPEHQPLKLRMQEFWSGKGDLS